MALDGNFVHELVDELSSLVGGRVNRVHQIDDMTVTIRIRSNRENHQLLISAHPTYSRFHITNEKYETPFDPPMFLRMLRRDIEGGFLNKIEQVGNDRRVHLHFNNIDEIGDPIERVLILEIMGRHSNIILTDENNKIIYAIKHLTPNNNERTVMPGFAYTAPPTPKKLNPRTEALDELPKHIDYNSGKIGRQILNHVEGFSPLFISELEHRAKYFKPDTIVSTIRDTLSSMKREPVLYHNTREDFYFSPLTIFEDKEIDKTTYKTLSDLLDDFYHNRYVHARVKQQAQDYYHVVAQNITKTKRKLENLAADLEESKSMDLYQKYGELLTAYMHSLNPYSESAKVFDYYTNKEIEIPLKKHLSPSENTQRYYSLYNKMKNRKFEAEKQIKITEDDLEYFENLLHQMESITTSDEVEEIREELVEQGLIKFKKGRSKKKKSNVTLNEFKTSNGLRILVGKNNKQNDYLTNRHAQNNHLWFHVKDMPGSHVVITHAMDEIKDSDISEAAMIAAYFSKGKQSESVPVDYTLIKHVKNIPGTKPGFVTYKNQSTVFVTPDEAAVKKLETKTP
ncbi:NFACT family protein [Phocicoccus pinnipedialis]|uniref:Rqc2 homolog RqcH n=1 Tax=Phocicoccus pinnipedialis TaxID=110845 RepID=A0A6V7RID6_9BACL|nr:NFACT RNA binding domain-containing protein [Jeotgalicoccus pinnipedialis]MBP1939059.1 putative ribosome quality control (RQC) complex YloA/Tae2 family protein [Jeotgalicoccus pinnipedialis]CAD2076974.1 Rqc2 RqcH [Jeotgalicoccus pinnipedialis]